MATWSAHRIRGNRVAGSLTVSCHQFGNLMRSVLPSWGALLPNVC